MREQIEVHSLSASVRPCVRHGRVNAHSNLDLWILHCSWRCLPVSVGAERIMYRALWPP
jgi:hypothetical protein